MSYKANWPTTDTQELVTWSMKIFS